MTKVVVTGALGYLGSKLVEVLERDDRTSILAIDNLAQGTPDAIRGRARVKLLETDILSSPLERHFENAEVVYHLAALANPSDSFSERAAVDRINIEGTRRVAQACARTSSVLVYPSTTSMYGKRAGSISEADAERWLWAQTPYADSKYQAECVLRATADIEGLRYAILRLGSLFGVSPGMHFRNAVQAFCRSAALTGRVEVWESAFNQRRPYCGVEDAARALVFAASHPVCFGRVSHAASVHDTVSGITAMLRASIGNLSVATVTHEAMNDFSFDVRCDRLMDLGFSFSGSLHRGIDEVLDVLAARVGAR
jgi:UDP-glucose 4-epimerase